MGSLFNLKHNKYTSTPDWFKDSKPISDSVAGNGTNYGGAIIGSTYNTVDYDEIPIDNSTIIWQDEKLSVPIDNDTIVIKNGKLVASFEQTDVLGDYVTVNGDQDVNGLKNFKPGILIDGVEVTKPLDNVIYIGSNLVVKGGITMYAEAGNADVSGIYEGLPIDMETLVRDENGVLMVNPDIDLGGASTWDELAGKPTWITVAKPKWDYETDIYNKPNLSIYATLDYVNSEFKKYVTLDTDQTIKGFKNFEKGLAISDINITKSLDDVIYIDSNLVVRGGITMYAEGIVDTPSILDSLPIASTIVKGIASFDSNYFSVSADGKVTLLEGNVGLNEAELEEYLTDLNYAKKSDIDSRIDTLIDGAPAAYDTLKEISDVLQDNVNSIDDIITVLGNKADKATTLAGYGITDAYTKNTVDSLLGKYVTLATNQTITGEKDFTGGLKVNGSPIVYNATNKYWKLEGDLLVTGGVTMYSNDSSFEPSTVMDAIQYDPNTLGINEKGQLYSKATSGGSGGSTEVAWTDIKDRPTTLSAFTDDVVKGKYLPLSGGTINSEEQIPITITSSHSNTGVGILLKNSNNVNPSGYVLANAQLGYTFNNGVYMFNYANYSSYNCAIGITNEGVAYVGKGGNIDTKYAIWHEGNLTPSNYQPLITSTSKLAYSLISGTPTLATVATSGKYSDLSGTPDLSVYLKTANLMSNIAVDGTTIGKNSSNQLYVKKDNIIKVVTELPAAANRTTNTLYIIAG